MRAFEAAECTLCHSGPMLSDYTLRAEGVAEHPLLTEADEGDGAFRFRTPSLRNVALTAPYMHNGMFETLEDVLAFYDRRRSENPNVSDQPRRPTAVGAGGPAASLDWDLRFLGDMTAVDIEDIISFLGALTDSDFDRTIPTSVPSGLTPGGAMAGP
jgi:cytochrome c peroxidase